MTDGLRWVFEAYEFGFSLIFCERLSPDEVLARLGAQRESVYPLTREQAQVIEVRNSTEDPYDLDFLEDLDVEAVEELGFLRPEVDAVIRAGTIEGWSFAVQASVSYVSSRLYLPALSRDTRVIAINCDVNTTQRVEYAIEGRVLSSFDPLIPAHNVGAEPSALAWPSAASGGMSPPETLDQLASEFGLWLPKASENQPLSAAALSTQM